LERELTTIELFAGIGGLMLGFEQAGFTTVSANEIDKPTVEYLKYNHAELHVDERSIEEVNGTDLLNGLAVGELDVLTGGPPCQGFSLIGLRNPSDSRNDLIHHYLRLLREIRPKTFLIENVPGMLSTDKRRYFPELLNMIRKCGYSIKQTMILDADDYGVPQGRKRIFIVGCREDLDINIDIPSITHLSPRKNIEKSQQMSFEQLEQLPKTPTVRDAISDLIDVDKYDHLVLSDECEYVEKPKAEYAKIMRGVLRDRTDFSRRNKWDDQICTGCRRTVHGEGITKRINETKQGDTVPISRLYRLSWDDVANTLRAGTPKERGAYSSPRPIHPEYPRVITVREGARLQSFPDWIRFHPTKWHGFRQIGNSVPPLLARRIAEEYKKGIELYESQR